MNRDEVEDSLKNQASYLEYQGGKGYVFKGSFISASGYLKLMRFGAGSFRWGSLWAGPKVFNHWKNHRD